MSGFATKASKLGFLQLAKAQRWSFSRAGCGVAVGVIEQSWSPGRKCFLQYCLSQRHRIGRRSSSLHELREQWAPMRGRSMSHVVLGMVATIGVHHWWTPQERNAGSLRARIRRQLWRTGHLALWRQSEPRLPVAASCFPIFSGYLL